MELKLDALDALCTEERCGSERFPPGTVDEGCGREVSARPALPLRVRRSDIVAIAMCDLLGFDRAPRRLAARPPFIVIAYQRF